MRDAVNIFFLKRCLCCDWIRAFYFDKRNPNLYEEYRVVSNTEPRLSSQTDKRTRIREKLKKLSILTGNSDSFGIRPIDETSGNIQDPEKFRDIMTSSQDFIPPMQSFTTKKCCCEPRKVVVKLVPGFIQIFVFFFLLVIWDLHFFFFS